MEQVRWGIVGCGAVTEVKSGPALQKADGSALVAVMRREGAPAEDYARRHGVPRWYADADRLIADPEVGAVYVATPVSTHMEYALRACRAGKPAYVEKPMARNHAECRRMVRAFREAGIPLFVAYYRRALPRFLKVRELLEAGALGVLTGVLCRNSSHRRIDPRALPWRLTAEHGGGGLIMDLGSHALDIIDFLLGPLSDVRGTATNRASAYDVEDSVAVSFRAGGIPGLGMWNFASSETEDSLEITGTEGRLALSVFGTDPLRVLRGGEVEEITVPHPEHVQQPLVQTVVDALRGRGSCESTGETAARTSRVLDLALGSYYGGRDDRFWERPETWPGRPRRGDQ